jgi:hypothetical protein
LLGLKSDDIDHIDLSDGVVDLSMDQFIEEEQGFLYTHFFPSRPELYDCDYKLIGTYQYEGDMPREKFGEYYDAIHRCITALRLYKPGSIGSLFIVETENESPHDESKLCTTSFSDDIGNEPENWGHGEGPYKLNIGEVDGFLTIYKQISNPAARDRLKKLEIGLRRFNNSYNRFSIEDKIIDLTIALESTVLFNIKDELRYRIALRGARLISSKMPPTSTFNSLQILYDLRSKIVHEGKSFMDLVDDNDFRKVIAKVVDGPQIRFIPLITQITRLILLEYMVKISNGKTLESINKAIDDALLA